jgi:2-C-methyl-D-erythritol 4-phosphate cytidylyltransferase
MFSTAILLAAGSGQRMAGHVNDKVLTPINGQPALVYSLQAFADSKAVDQFVIVYRDEAQKAAIKSIIATYGLSHLSIQTVQGGAERQLSVLNALNLIDEACEYVFIHDAARPLVSVASIQALDKAVRRDGAAVLAHPVTDTIKRIPKADQLQSAQLEDLDRSRLWAMETPQAFSCPKIREAYQHAHTNNLKVTDDTAAAASIGLRTTLVLNKLPNPKITTPTDLAYIGHILKERRV